MNSFYKVTCHTDHVGPGSTFVAVKGFKEDGSIYIPKALERGATTIVIEQGTELTAEVTKLIQANATVLVVESSRKALAELAAEAYGYPANKLKLIALTGTKGKTTTAFLLYHMLRTAGHRVALLGTVKSCINDTDYETPLTTPQPDYLHAFFDECVKDGVEYVIMEAAAQALSMSRLETLTFNAIAFTNFSLEHSEFYENMDEYFAAKCQLFDHVENGLVVLNADDERVASAYKGNARTCLFSMQGNGDLNGTIQESTLNSLRVAVSTGNVVFDVQSSSLLGEFSAANILTAIALAQECGVGTESLQQALKSFTGVPGRLARYVLPNNAVAIIDNAHTPSSFEAFFKAVRPLSGHIIAVFGAGGDRDKLKRPVMGALAAKYADEVVLTTDNPRSEDPAVIVQEVKQGIEVEYLSKVTVVLDREQAIRDAFGRTKQGSLLVLLGKGPVEYQHVQDEKIPFSEVAILHSLRS